jgi:hypothetical protein
MTYSSSSNPPFLMSVPPIAGGFTVGSSDMRGGMWFYGSSDSIATVFAAGYFTDGAARGMHRGDVVFVFDTNTPKYTVGFCSSVSTTGVSLSTFTT